MFGKTGLLLLAAAAGFRVVNADFMVYTEPPIPTSAIPPFANPSAAASWTTSVYLNAFIAYHNYVEKQGAPFSSSSSSAASEIAAFVSTANYSIPAAVTDDSTTTTFYSKPNWYSALPTGARTFKEAEVSAQFSIVRSVIGGTASKTSASSGAMPTAWVGRDASFGVGAAAIAAVFL